MKTYFIQKERGNSQIMFPISTTNSKKENNSFKADISFALKRIRFLLLLFQGIVRDGARRTDVRCAH